MTPISESEVNTGESGGRVLVVDDEPINRELLVGLLEPHGYEVRGCGDGREALRILPEFSPDCILLDLVMPAVGGIEVCRSVKSDPGTAMVPVIVITANTEHESRLEAIEAGADDFLTKPYDADEVVLRVRNSIRMKRLYDQVESDLRRLRTLEETKDTFTHMLIHDLKQPLTAIKAYANLLALRLEEAHDKTLSPFARKVEGFVESVESMIALILDITRLEEQRLPLKLEEFELREILREPVALAGELASRRGIRVETDMRPARLHCDRELVARIAENLLSNAIKYSPDGGVVLVRVERQEGSVGYSVADAGPGIPAKYSSGIGLAFCKLAVEAHGGSIWVEDAPGGGSVFRVRLPALP